MTESELIDLMKSRGFEYSYKTPGENFCGLVFEYVNPEKVKVGRYQVPHYICKVEIPSMNFEFSYIVPCSFNTLSTPTCQPVDSDKQFFKIATIFESQIAVLERFLGVH